MGTAHVDCRSLDYCYTDITERLQSKRLKIFNAPLPLCRTLETFSFLLEAQYTKLSGESYFRQNYRSDRPIYLPIQQSSGNAKGDAGRCRRVEEYQS
jgi:hypothetical protein